MLRARQEAVSRREGKVGADESAGGAAEGEAVLVAGLLDGGGSGAGDRGSEDGGEGRREKEHVESGELHNESLEVVDNLKRLKWAGTIGSWTVGL